MAIISTHRSAPPSRATVESTWSRRRWMGVLIAALALVAALLAGAISARTVLMLGGSLLAFAMSADRLDQKEE